MDDKPNSLLANLESFELELSQAETGNVQAAKHLLLKVSELIASGQPLPNELAQWVSQGLQTVAEGGDAKKVFFLKKPAGKPRKMSEETERLVAMRIHTSPRGLHKGINADGTLGAYSEAAEAFGITENTAEAIYKRNIDTLLHEEALDRELKDADE